MSNRGPKFNNSGCRDITAHDAVNNVCREEKAIKKKVGDYVKIVKILAEILGLEIDGRIKVIDKKSGKKFE